MARAKKPKKLSADVLMQRGVANLQGGKPKDACADFLKAIKNDPANAHAHHLCGIAHHYAGLTSRAIPHMEKATRLQPDNWEFRNNFGQMLRAGGDAESARDQFERARTLAPRDQGVLNNLGNAYADLQDFAKARACFEEILQAAPDNVMALYNFGVMLNKAGEHAEAMALLNRALAKEPMHLDARVTLGSCHFEMGQYDEAQEIWELVLKTDPANPKANFNLGKLLHDTRRFDEADALYRRAIATQPDYEEALVNHATNLKVLGDRAEAIACYETVLKNKPHDTYARNNLSLLQLSGADFSNGWVNYQSRMMPEIYLAFRDQITVPEWTGQSLAGKSICLWDEQGVGDSVLFTSMLAELLATASSVTLICDPRLIDLYGRSFPGLELLSKEIPVAEMTAVANGCNVLCRTGDLGKMLRRDLSAFPAPTGYLKADNARATALAENYRDGSNDLLIGISWRSINIDIGDLKSMPLANFEDILSAPGIRTIDLQYGETEEERQRFATDTGIEIYRDPEIDSLQDLDGFAAQVRAMDLIVTISNTTAHFAGALGVPTILLLHTAPIWYWMADGATTPWYASLKLFRQAKVGAWDTVIRDAAAATHAFVDEKKRSA